MEEGLVFSQSLSYGFCTNVPYFIDSQAEMKICGVRHCHGVCVAWEGLQGMAVGFRCQGGVGHNGYGKGWRDGGKWD